MKGIIFDLKRFAVHDGGGLRSTLFLKGCPLHCPWCQNPEGMDSHPALWYSPNDCLSCGTCVAACPGQALTLKERIHVEHGKCTLCGTCEDVCPGSALQRMGAEVTAREAAEMLLRDSVFFGEDGGVTLSGGEVLMQWEFAAEILRLCREQGADTAIETCLLAPKAAIQAMLPVTNQFLIDIKYLDPALHREILGADNRRILENYEFLVDQGAKVLVRTPLIPGYTATEENIRSIARYIKSIDEKGKYELLNFNPLCRSKYAAMEKKYPVEGKAFSEEEMERFYGILKEEGILYIIKE
ncbi:glycyl-radical enzyme activating protein [Candidatus Merdisoma sp. JLR.KK006]|jgi:pyruvate formate lyase activating enzyme|uniref:glycyl-radical enzyme activating protein n=1 Tax=Candidatus Merdisoma sp. JLR.KK006 TaxID=3112626 RepID=UPI002FF2FEB5